MAYLDKWKTDFPASVGNETRPTAGIDNTLDFNTDGFRSALRQTRLNTLWKMTLALSFFLTTRD